MTAQWSRQHDALIARVAEGATKIEAVPPPVSLMPADRRKKVLADPDSWEEVMIHTADGLLLPLPHYLTDLTAGVRAASKWTWQESDHRGFWVGVDSCHDAGPEAELWDDAGEKRFWSQGETYEAALAWALWAACSNGESDVKTT